MSMSKTALLSLLIACWIVGLLNQFHGWETTLRYLIPAIAGLPFMGDYLNRRPEEPRA